jgi:hypothetical protein
MNKFPSLEANTTMHAIYKMFYKLQEVLNYRIHEDETKLICDHKLYND